MSRILLDTSGYSAFMRGHDEASSEIRHASEIWLSSIVVGELLAGFTLGRHTARNRGELERFLASPRAGVLPVDEETSARYAVIYAALRRRGTPIPTNDLWIAATAMQHGLRVVTLDHDFLHVPQVIATVLTN